MNTDQAYQDGYDAKWYDAAPVSANPFNALSQSQLFDCWYQGWLDARDTSARKHGHA
jgi:hypothetical protein